MRQYFSAPLVVTLDVTNKCNARCVMCYSSSTAQGSDGELTLGEIRGLVKDLAEMGVFTLCISGGEPMCRPDIFEIVESARAEGLHVTFGSNGLSIDHSALRRLKDLGVGRLVISVHAVTPDLHDRIRGVKGSHQKALEVLAEAKSLGLKTGISTTLMKLNLHEWQDIIGLAVEMGIEFHSMSLFVAVGRGTLDLDLSPQEYKRFFEQWLELRSQLSGRITLESHHETLAPILDDSMRSADALGCVAGRSILRITATGDVTPCNLLPLTCGNIREVALDDIWHHSPLLRLIRNRRYLYGPCKKCSLVDCCGGCRSTAFAYYKDVLASDPRCWYRADGLPDSETVLPETPAAVRQVPDIRVRLHPDVRFRKEWDSLLVLHLSTGEVYELELPSKPLLERCRKNWVSADELVSIMVSSCPRSCFDRVRQEVIQFVDYLLSEGILVSGDS